MIQIMVQILTFLFWSSSWAWAQTPPKSTEATKPALVAAVKSQANKAVVGEAQKGSDALVGFQSWKTSQVSKAKTALASFKTPTMKTNPEAAEPGLINPETVENSEEKAEIKKIHSNQAERLRQLEFNLEIALGLTIHDYFSLYLKNKSQAEMATIIPKLSADELSALLIAYRKSLDGLPVTPKEEQSTINQNL